MEIRIYFEGDKQLRMGFNRLLGADKVRGAARLRILSTGGDPIGDFKTALRDHPNSINILLLDSEQPLDGKGTRELQARQFPAEHVFWMVELMESWFLADRAAFRSYYNNDPEFREVALPGNPHVEQIPKSDVQTAIERATRGTRKGSYHKIKHAPGILQGIDPERLKASAPNFKRLVDFIQEKLAG